MNSQLSIGNLVTIGNMKFHDIEGGFGKDKRAMLVKEIAEIHNQPLGEINRRINENRKHFIDSKDIIDLKGTKFAMALAHSGIYSQNAINASTNIYILSERGYSKLLKIMDDDLAWEKYDQLVDGYFQMRRAIKDSPEFLKSAKSKYRALPPVNHSVEILQKVWLAAGVDQKRAAAAVSGIYKQVYGDLGIDIPGAPVECDKTYDKEQIAKALGVYSKSGKPHSQAIAAIIRTMNIPADLIEHSPFAANGHSDDYDRYKEPVLNMVRDWLASQTVGAPIVLDKSYHVVYRQVGDSRCRD